MYYPKEAKEKQSHGLLGLTSEHFKLGGRDLISFLTDFLNPFIESKHISAVLKEGILTQIYKKGGVTDPGNYRDITVTPVLLKILERILNNRHSEILDKTQSKLQRGLTQGCSSLNEALILTECVLESKNNKQDILLNHIRRSKSL